MPAVWQLDLAQSALDLGMGAIGPAMHRRRQKKASERSPDRMTLAGSVERPGVGNETRRGMQEARCGHDFKRTL